MGTVQGGGAKHPTTDCYKFIPSQYVVQLKKHMPYHLKSWMMVGLLAQAPAVIFLYVFKDNTDNLLCKYQFIIQ